MFKNLSLGFKISAGFAAILIIAIILGGFCVFSMKNAQTQSNKLAYEYVPEVDLGNSIERNTAKLMYELRGYAYTGNEDFYKEGLARLERTKEQLNNASELAKKYTGLVKLKELSSVAQSNIDEYEKLIAATESNNKVIGEARTSLDAAAKAFMDNCDDFLVSQYQAMEKDIASNAGSTKLNERLDKISNITAVINLGNGLRVANFKAQALRDPKLIQNVLGNFDKIDANCAAIRKITYKDVNLKQLDEIKKAGNAYKENLEKLVSNWTKLEEVNAKRTEIGSNALANAEKIAKAGMAQTKDISTNAAITMAASSTIMIIGLIIAVIVGSALAYFIVIGITKPVNRIVEGLNEGSQQVASASEQLSSSSQQLAEGSAEQASSIEETSSTLEESASMVRQNTENTKQAALLAKQAKDASVKGNNEMQNMMQSMEELKKSSDQIAKIIKVIDEIAFQTNILALNAAVEAARAGEAGQGFAVVAEEVRNLAQRSAQAAKDTAGIIESNIQLSEQGVTVSKQVNDSLTEINTQSQKVSELLDEVAAASQEQAQGIAQINKAISQMEQVVQSNASTAEESASASEELSAQAVTMQEIVNSLVALVNGAKAIQQQAYTAIAAHHKSERRQPISSGAPKKLTTASAPKDRKDTKVVNPEDVIPLEDDTGGF